ncbi:MAG: response regulator [Nitrospirae bacterium]|nr:response regulator [Nitrospirota bacterium]
MLALQLKHDLEHIGHSVAGIYASGEEALGGIETARPDLVLMDIKLQGEMDGIETADRINRQYDIPVIYMTAHSEESTIERAKMTGPYGYLLKPVNVKELQIAVEVSLYKSKSDKEKAQLTQELRSALEKNREAEEALRKTNEDLEYRVVERTKELDTVNKELKAKIMEIIRNEEERKLAEQEAENMRQAIAHMSRVSTLSELATSLAHELNQPLTAIMTNSSAALRMLSGKFDPEEIREILEDIIADDKRAAKMIRRIREPLKKDTLEPRSLAVNDLVRDIHRLVRNDALLARVSIELKLADALPAIRGDRIQLQQVLLNLVINALDAVKGSASDLRRIQINTTSGRDGSVAVEVSDSGPGIPETSLCRIFEPFYTTKTKGLGLGLSICKTIIETHRGSILAENRPEGGARFVIVLPAENP